MKDLYEMRGQGHSIRGIARELGVSRNSVRKYLRSPGVPQAKRRPPRASKLDAYTGHIDRRLGEGLDNCVVLLRELQSLGYEGSYTILSEHVRLRRPRREPRGDDAVRDGAWRAAAGGLGELRLRRRRRPQAPALAFVVLGRDADGRPEWTGGCWTCRCGWGSSYACASRIGPDQGEGGERGQVCARQPVAQRLSHQ